MRADNRWRDMIPHRDVLDRIVCTAFLWVAVQMISCRDMGQFLGNANEAVLALALWHLAGERCRRP